jgi:hypothetical protein
MDETIAIMAGSQEQFVNEMGKRQVNKTENGFAKDGIRYIYARDLDVIRGISIIKYEQIGTWYESRLSYEIEQALRQQIERYPITMENTNEEIIKEFEDKFGKRKVFLTGEDYYWNCKFSNEVTKFILQKLAAKDAKWQAHFNEMEARYHKELSDSLLANELRINKQWEKRIKSIKHDCGDECHCEGWQVRDEFEKQILDNLKGTE